MPDFLLEIGTEEIPARMIDGAREELAARITALLVREHLSPLRSAISSRSFSTPRRLAVLVRDVLEAQPDAQETVNGPAVKIAFKDGAPTAAAEAFAKRVKQPVSELKTITTAKGEYLSAAITQRGRPAREVLAEALAKEIAGIYWPKSMYWRAGRPERFVRPLRWIVALLDAEIIPFEFGGIASSNTTRGHRILDPREIAIHTPGDYEQAMAQGGVVADPQERARIISEQMEALAMAKGLRVRRHDALLDTVVNLTEAPSVIMGSFEREYLELPEEVLVTAMRDHQKYFALEDEQGKLAPHFLAVLNTQADDRAAALITHGNERVLRARFNDARFFWNADQRIPLMGRSSMLAAVTFQKELGSYAEKSARMVGLVNWLAAQVSPVDAGAAETAASLAKCDLTTELVKEFTELQGVIGGLYARSQGHSDAVATAIYDQYKPVSAESDAPRSKEGALVSISDKADSIAGMFALGLIPSGSKDPFALRRQANGLVKAIHAHALPIRISALLNAALHAYDGSEAQSRFRNSEYEKSIATFFRERVEFYLKDVLGFAYDVVNAVLAVDSDDVSDGVLRAQAVTEVRSSSDFEAIAVSFKRMQNILRQALQRNYQVGEFFPEFATAEETQIFTNMNKGDGYLSKYIDNGNYPKALQVIVNLKPHVDEYFEKVLVMAEDEDVRKDRLSFLNMLIGQIRRIADFSDIVAAEK
ncbi:MAG: glycine--tRNA ligase subunit beta [Acidobacteriaceae bacterium]